MSNEISKMCPVCREYKPLSAYGVRMRNCKNIGQGYCKVCKKKLDREYVQRTRGKNVRKEVCFG